MINIYKLYSPSNPHLIYIGSTSNTLKKRKSSHIGKWNLFNKGSKNYCNSFRLVKYDDCEILLLENCSEEQRKFREQIYIIIAKLIYKNGCCNKQYPISIASNYSSPVRKRRHEKSRKLNLKNNPEKVKAYKSKSWKKYYQKNKEKIQDQKAKKVLCECGKIHTNSNR